MQPPEINLDQRVGKALPQARNRRRCVRQRVHSPAYVILKAGAGPGPPDVHEILNIGEAGMSFQSSARLSLGQRLMLSLDLPETGNTVHSKGQVMWSEASGRTGVRFRKMSLSSLLRLREWLFVNAIAACVHHATRQARAPESAAQDKTAEASRVSSTALRQELEGLTPGDYASILTELAAIQKQVKDAGPELDPALHLINEHARNLTGANGAAIALRNGEEMICRASSGSAPGMGARFHLGAGFSGECVRAAELLRCDDSENDARVDRESCRALCIRSVMAAPVPSVDGVIGLLEIFSPEPFAFNAKSKIFLQRLAQMTTAAVQYAAEALEEKKRSDSVLAGAVSAGGFGFEEYGGGEVPAETPPASAEEQASRFSVHWRILLVAAAATLIILAAWLAPTTRNRVRGSGPAASQPRLPAQRNRSEPSAAGPASESDFDQLRRLAEQGDPAAQFALGAHYALGEDVAQDYPMACHWFALAAEQGHVIAQATLGAYYWAGRGVPQDLNKAYFWSVLAQAGGDEASKYRVAALASSMSHSQIVAAQEEANDWLRQHQLSSKNASPSRQ